MEEDDTGGKMKAYKIKLRPTSEQKELFKKYFGCYRFMYNKIIKLYNKNVEVD